MVPIIHILYFLNRLLQLQISKCVFLILCLIAIIQFFSCFGKYKYPHLPADEIETKLYKKTTPKLILKKGNLDCKYDHILKSKESIESWEIPKQYDDFATNGLVNGSYAPEDCNPLFSVAVLVTYRNTQSQLDIFLPYMHNFLRRQNIHYKALSRIKSGRVIIVDDIFNSKQQDEKPWNKGVLYNIGAKHAISDKFPCLILHDVDLLPLDTSNLYACTAEPRHMSASIDKFRYVLTYDYLVGGVLAIKTDQYVMVNGLSNKFQGWGGEDDDFAARIEDHQLNVVRFPRPMSRYTMLVHRQEPKNGERLRIMSENKRGRGGGGGAADGLSSVALVYSSAHLVNHRLFALVGVKL